MKLPGSSAALVGSLEEQWRLCIAANPRGDERCNRPKCKRCNRGVDYRRRVRTSFR